MAIYLGYNKKGRSSLLPTQWGVEESPAKLKSLVPFVNSITADGQELEYIRGRFQDVPLAFRQDPNSEFSRKFSAPIQANPKLNLHPQQLTWFGDMAKFILANL